MEHEGLYRKEYEHDACGVGFVANLHNVPSHDIIRMGIEVLENLEHRGACGCDENSGDGAGIQIQIPHKFFQKVCEPLGIELPEQGQYGVGFYFLPRKAEEIEYCRKAVTRILEEEGLVCLGWRVVPVDNSSLGPVARSTEPTFHQVFVGRPAHLSDDADFERSLFVARKLSEHAIKIHSNLSEKRFFHAITLSMRRIIYKGELLAPQVDKFYPDLADPDFTSAMALVHQRYSTNTFPTWDLAHPFRYIAHNGEINTVRGNQNWMRARQYLFESEKIKDIDRLFPIIPDGQSDSACLDNAVELLFQTGRGLPHAVTMLIPEAWQNHETMSQAKKDYYEYHSCLMEPWDGPASIAFTDGRVIGAVLDRNGLRPSRYWVTKDGLVIMASEAGVLDIAQDRVVKKGRLEPGRMFLADLTQHRIISDEEIKKMLVERKPYGQWLKDGLIHLDKVDKAENPHPYNEDALLDQQQAFGYTLEDMRILIAPMAKAGKEAHGSMGNDAALAVLSDKPRLLYDYFKQLFAQVTNPPLDAIREELVTSLVTNIGAEHDLFQETANHCKMLRLDQPVLTNEKLERIRRLTVPYLRSTTISTVWPRSSGAEGLRTAMARICEEAAKAVQDGNTVVILSDRALDKDHVPIPALLAVAGVHHHLIRNGLRTQCGLVVESGEPRETHHFCMLSAFGANAYNPYVVLDSIEQMRRNGEFGDKTTEQLEKNFVKGVGLGLLKTMSKMGISTLASYRGAQICEAVGLNSEVIDNYFTRTASRIQGIGLETIALEAIKRHMVAFPDREIARNLGLDMGGQYHWRRNGERHMINPFTVSKLQEATSRKSYETFEEYAELVDNDSRSLCTIRGLMKFKKGNPVPLEEVESASEIVKRFKTGAMSLGSISREAHETLAIAMNTLGGKSNTGEGGEDPTRFTDNRCSAIKQVASGRFGVTINYLVNAKEIQIKMAQGAKPGEGGALGGNKVDKYIGSIRNSTPGVGLISPPPHHDIYSIEDMAQLIHDLKNSNPEARINVKLVSEVGVGTVAAGVAKGKADVVLISGHDGGTGNSPLSSIKHAGLPWELGLAETHQTLLKNDLRSRIVVETDGQLKTGRDVAIAALLGAEEYGFSTAPLITIGCIMMRKCHLNTCPVGIATQDPVLRKKFTGQPEHVVNFFFFVAEQMRQIMAELGFRTVNEMVGRTDLLDVSEALNHWKMKGLDLSAILARPNVPASCGTYCTQKQDHGLEKALDNQIVADAKDALEEGRKINLSYPIRNINRTVGTILSHNVAKKWGLELLPEDTIHVSFTGTAGNSFGAFLAKGIWFHINGDANDYFGKGLSGGKLSIRPTEDAEFVAEENIIIGNVAFYGATNGKAFIRGMGGERFCVRNSGVQTVIEGVGDHGCEYMTGGRVICLGRTGRNFAAGMSGGIAWVYDADGSFPIRCNRELVDLDPFDPADEDYLRGMLEEHVRLTGSTLAERMLNNWENERTKFVKVFPSDYKRVLKEREEEKVLEAADATDAMAGAK